jgi:hypothetical protein
MPDDELGRRLWDYRWGMALRQFYLPRRAPKIVPRHAELYDYTAERLGPDNPIDLLEFGVAHGNTVRAFVSRFRSPEARFVGFDSFVGLPEPWQSTIAVHSLPGARSLSSTSQGFSSSRAGSRIRFPAF